MKFLVIDDTPDILETVSLCIKLRWPTAEVFTATDGEKGLLLAGEQWPDLVILDIGLPGKDGLEVLRALRGFSEVPVMMLTVREGDVNIARFLEEGADDYMTKPFSPMEFLGRLQALLRRQHRHPTLAGLRVEAGELVMDFGTAEIYLAGKPVKLTRTEWVILEQLVKAAPGLVTYESLISKALRIAQPAASDSKVVRVHVQHLRAKLGDSADAPKYIANVSGVGYKFLQPVSSSFLSVPKRN